MLDALSVPPKHVLRALDDLHTLAEGVRRLTDREGDLTELLESVKALPAVEDQLSISIDALRADVQALHAWLQPLHQELTDVDATAEQLQTALARVDETIAGLHAEIQDLRRRIPGI
jgi:chromosome segregation ATPase